MSVFLYIFPRSAKHAQNSCSNKISNYSSLDKIVGSTVTMTTTTTTCVHAVQLQRRTIPFHIHVRFFFVGIHLRIKWFGYWRETKVNSKCCSLQQTNTRQIVIVFMYNWIQLSIRIVSPNYYGGRERRKKKNGTTCAWCAVCAHKTGRSQRTYSVRE